METGEVTRRILATYESGRFVTRCSWCGRVVLDGEWVRPPRAALTAIDAGYSMTHTICPLCTAEGSSPDGPRAFTS
jgi:hypothetical protein